jgi:microcystin-dependent protein
MSNCSDCYSGCSEITSDRCVKYTGVDIPVLGIVKGDSLSFVEQALASFLVATLDGTGITIDIDEDLYCDLVSEYLAECTTVTAKELFKALVQAACNLQTQIDTVNATLATLNDDYVVDCLDDVETTDDTHTIVQAVITKLCTIDTALTALTTDVSTNYVQLSDLNALIAAYIESTTSTTSYSSRMIPYAVVPYVGSLEFFDLSGAGIEDTEWENIYLCNGENGTPDLRGRTLTGVIAGVPGGALNSNVDPGTSAFNPNYALGDLEGTNSITLIEDEIPAHTHTTTVTDPGHDHDYEIVTANSYTGAPTATTAGSGDTDPETTTYQTSSEATGITVAVDNAGGGEAHANIQPVYAVYYITYIPAA